MFNASTTTATTTTTTTTASRTPADRALAQRMLQKVRSQVTQGRDRNSDSHRSAPLIDGGPMTPDKQRSLARYIQASRVDAKTALAIAFDRLLDEMDMERTQPLPFDEAATRVEHATNRHRE